MSLRRTACQGRSQRKPCPPIVNWVDFFNEKTGFVWTSYSVLRASNMPKMRCRPGPSRTPLGELTTLPRRPSRWGGGHPNLQTPRRLRRLDSRAFGAQLLWPQCKILAIRSAACVTLKPPPPAKGDSKTQMGCFCYKIWLSATKFLCLKTGSDKCYSVACLTVHKWLWGTSPSRCNFPCKRPASCKNGDFQSIFARIEHQP